MCRSAGGGSDPEGKGLEGTRTGSFSLVNFLTKADWGRVQQVARYLCPGSAASMLGRAVIGTDVLKEHLGIAFGDGLQEIEGWLDFAQAAEDLEALDDDVWHGGTILTQAGRQEVSRSLSWQLADFLEQAAKVKSFWAAAGSQTDGMTKDFVQRAAELSHALPLAGVWRVCEPLEAEIIAFVHRVCGGGDGDFTHEAAGKFDLLVEAVEEYMRRAREMLDQLEALALDAKRRAPARPKRR